jgi:phospholipid-binding lipoprotein MlaA
MSRNKSAKYFSILGVLFTLSSLMGCGKAPSVDRFEMLNRSTYAFNKGLDRVLIKPVTRAYEGILPKPIQRMVGNFFQNLSEIPNVANDILQGNFPNASYDSARFVLNTTLGIGGLFDVAGAGKRGLERHHQDFGLTLAKWGYKESSYFVLPILGPSTLRDAVGLAGTYYMSVPGHLQSVAWRNRLLVLNYVETRASLLKAEPLIGEAVDEYVFIRDAYLQRRKFLMNGEQEASAASSTQPILEGPPE